jgi:membrane-associated phospholipid phosphatase
MHSTTATKAAVVALLIAATSGAPYAAQQLGPALVPIADTALIPAPAPSPVPFSARSHHAVRWWEAAAVVGGAGLLLADDRHCLHETREHPTDGADDAATAFRRAGDVKVYGALTFSMLGVGIIAGSSGITRTGAQLAASGLLSAATFGLLKEIGGRSRPDASRSPYDFHPFSGSGSFTSGHSAMAFALATTLGDASHSTLATVGLYAIATGTAWSRVYNGRHWPSDVFLGAAIGVTAAKFVNGRWRIFGLQSPELLASPARVGLQASF